MYIQRFNVYTVCISDHPANTINTHDLYLKQLHVVCVSTEIELASN